eukprot:SAG31_NODE_173_length_21354_cov_16.826112_20_plen_58_part_00
MRCVLGVPDPEKLSMVRRGVLILPASNVVLRLKAYISEHDLTGKAIDGGFRVQNGST